MPVNFCQRLGSLRTERNPSQRAPRGPMGRLVRRTEPHEGERRHNRHPRLGDRPGRAAWLAEQGTRFRSALDRGYAARFQTNERDRTMKITASNLTHWAGLSAIVAGIMYVFVGLSHTFVSHYGGLASV